jgi:hypothetical protein
MNKRQVSGRPSKRLNDRYRGIAAGGDAARQLTSAKVASSNEI